MGKAPNTTPLRFTFFGTPNFAVTVLKELESEDFLPSLIVTAPDKPKGRGLKLTPSPVKVWAETRNIPILQPTSLADPDFLAKLKATSYEVFVVAAYGKIIPKNVLDIPTRGTLNVHPSLLPKYRGPSPVEAQILKDERDVGVSIILLDEKMDHGPVVKSFKLKVESLKSGWPPRAKELEEILAHEGGKLLAEAIPRWVAGELAAVPQNEQEATYCSLIKKGDACVDLRDDAHKNFLKIRAYDKSPRAYTFAEKEGKKIRLIITDADYKDGTLEILRVIPEGKREMSYRDFLKSQQ